VPISRIDEDPANPRTEFPDNKVAELADDIRQHGIREPLVFRPESGNGRYLLHFGAMRLRAAARAGLTEVPVVVRAAPVDRYAQVGENLRRHHISPLDLPRFVRNQMNAGDSQTTIAKQLGMNLTTVAHHLSLLELLPVLDEAMKAGRCTSPPDTARVEQATRAATRAGQGVGRWTGRHHTRSSDFVSLRARVEALSSWSVRGSDGQTA
jgi:ParB family chromosome partitioning protein